ncbi:MAG TPA: DUF3656 domain-containing protein [Methanoregulaceae archaeon]|nr:DUF3656 domain-containing protein [Methanoregulaceae archaeon]
MTAPSPPPKTRNRPLPELLAPAGTMEAFLAALAAGADAVYLGGKRFGARQYAGNFDEAGIESAVAAAHARGVKVYVTANTLVHDRELKSALEYLIRLHAMGVDAVLVQDVGLASLAREIIPSLPLHASTQVTVHNAAGVQAMAAMGFSRVVLARELPLSEIEEIARETAATGIGLEVFAHGALCFSYSGQCLLSSVIGGRSGNRGMCAQPCRKPYTLVTGPADPYGRPARLRALPLAGRYLLSPKDLCVYRKLGRLVHSPVVSLKIEGRMKSPGYVAVVTSVYRRALDAIADGRDPYAESDERDLALAFNRGFTDGYLFGHRHAAVMGCEQPDNRGLCIGTVAEYRPRTGEAAIALRTPVTPIAGDGLFVAGDGSGDAGTGFPLNANPERSGDRIVLRVPSPVREGSTVFLTASVALAATVRKIIAGGCPGLRRPLPLDCTVTIDPGGRMTIEGTVDPWIIPPVRFRYAPDFTLMPARTRPLTRENLKENLEKTGGTPFILRNVEIRYDGGMFAPVSAINHIRRELLACAEEALVAAFRPPEEEIRAARDRLAAALPDRPPVFRPEAGSGPLLVVITDTVPGVREAARGGAGTVCFEPDVPDPGTQCRCRGQEEDFREEVRAAIRHCRDAGVPVAMKLPRILRQPALSAILAALPGLTDEGLSACMAGDAGALAAVRSRCPDLDLIGGPEMNIFNHTAARFAAGSCRTVLLSPELSGSEIEELVRRTRSCGCDVGFGMIVQGDLEVMISENCVLEPVRHCGDDATRVPGFTGLRDETGRVFPVRTDGNCRTRVLNADETCLIDHLPEMVNAGIAWICIDARGKTPAYTLEITRIYREALSCIAGHAGDGIPAGLARLKERARGIAQGRITAGHYLHGLKEA